jgi:DNA-binding transcriptional MerR regulator
MYSQEEVSFINTALRQGYSMEAIQSALNSRRAQVGRLPQVNALEQRLDMLQQHIETQEYKAAEAAFIDKLTEFGNKFGLSEQDLVTFGQTAYAKGINIAMGNVDLETVFRAVFPEQYAIRSRRIAPANSSQIYGGSSAAEPTGAQAQKAAAEYAKQYLLGTMPNYPRNK